MYTKVEVNPDVSPSLHPQVVYSMKGCSAESIYLLEPLYNVFANLYTSLGTVHKARQSANVQTAWPLDYKILRTAAIAEPLQKNATAKLDSTFKGYQSNVAVLERTIDKPIKSRESDAQFAAEVRSHFKSLGKADRLNFLRDSIESDDLTTSTSVLGAPFYLSGLSEVEHATYLRMLREAQLPEEVQQLTAKQAGMDLIMKRGDLVRTEFERAIGANWIEVERIRNSNPDIARAVKKA